MLDTPQIVTTSEQRTAAIHLTIPRAEIQTAMGPAIGELMSVIQAQGVAPAGPLAAHHFRMTPETFDFEVCVPVTSAVTPSGRVKPSRLPAARVIRTIYHGPYEGLGAAWGEFMQWIEAQGLQTAEDLWECYLAGPESNPDPAKWQTELNRPLVG